MSRKPENADAIEAIVWDQRASEELGEGGKNLRLFTQYHSQTISQADRAFKYSQTFAVAGFLLIAASIVWVVLKPEIELMQATAPVRSDIRASEEAIQTLRSELPGLRSSQLDAARAEAAESQQRTRDRNLSALTYRLLNSTWSAWSSDAATPDASLDEISEKSILDLEVRGAQHLVEVESSAHRAGVIFVEQHLIGRGWKRGDESPTFEELIDLVDQEEREQVLISANDAVDSEYVWHPFVLPPALRLVEQLLETEPLIFDQESMDQFSLFQERAEQAAFYPAPPGIELVQGILIEAARALFLRSEESGFSQALVLGEEISSRKAQIEGHEKAIETAREELKQIREQMRNREASGLAEYGTPMIGLVAGTVIEVISALFFMQTNRARRQLAEFFDRLREDRKFDEGLKMIASIQDGDAKASVQSAAAMVMINGPGTEPPAEADDA